MHTENLVPFAFGDSLVRVVRDESGNPWFVAKDVAKALDYEWNGMKNLQHVPEEWRGVETVSTPSGTQEMLTLSEPGLYFFLGRSDKPKALPFQKWIAGEVLPSIRKTGRYVASGRPGKLNMALPDNLPQSALCVRPAMRQRLWRDALRTAAVENGDIASVMEWFDILCRMVAAAPAPEPSSRDKVRSFCRERCHAAPGVTLPASTLYDAFRKWHCGQKGDLPTRKVFGEVMQEFARRYRANGSMYEGLSLKQA